MTEITIKLSGREVTEILNGLLNQGYEFGNRAESLELKVMEYKLDDNEDGERIAAARAKRCRDHERSAYSAYDKIKAEALRLGLIS